jgi:hypothetical protein
VSFVVRPAHKLTPPWHAAPSHANDIRFGRQGRPINGTQSGKDIKLLASI